MLHKSIKQATVARALSGLYAQHTGHQYYLRSGYSRDGTHSESGAYNTCTYATSTGI